MNRITAKLELRSPWWMGLYFRTLALFHNARLVEADPDIAAQFVTRHTRWRVGRDKWQKFLPSI